MRFASRLVLGTVMVVAITVLVLVATSELSLRTELEQGYAELLGREARLVRAELPADSLLWQATIQRLARASGNRITLIDRTGRVRTDSDIPPEQLASVENHLRRPEVQAALDTGAGSAERVSVTVGEPLLYVAVPGGPGVIRVAAGLGLVNRTVRGAQRSVLTAGILALLLGIALAWIAGQSIARPLTGIAGAARAIAAGNVPRFPRSGISDIDGLVQALRQMTTQLSERFEQLRREQAEMATLIDSMVEGVVAADARGRIITANGAARRMLGYEPDVPLPDLPQLFRIKAAREVVDQGLAGTAVVGRELELDGRTLLLNARPLPQGGVVLVLFDLSEMRRLEAVRRDFVANVSHELKTPLTSISGYTETLLTDRPPDDTARQFLGVILANARRMQRLVDSLLDLSRIESGRWQPHPAPQDAGAIARETWAALENRKRTRRIEFVVEPAEGGPVHSDPDALRQVLTNLLENAARHTPSGGRIAVTVAPEDGGTALSVSDSGAGIPRDHLPRIFERFYRADSSRSREQGGTGLGLAIVKHLVEAHGGRVGAESEVGVGTTITCWFPGA